MVKMKDYIQIGIEKGLIFFNEDKSRIKYISQKKEPKNPLKKAKKCKPTKSPKNRTKS